MMIYAVLLRNHVLAAKLYNAIALRLVGHVETEAHPVKIDSMIIYAAFLKTAVVAATHFHSTVPRLVGHVKSRPGLLF